VAVAGEAGVAWVLELLRSEIDRVMAMCGWDRLADVDRSVLFTPLAVRGEAQLKANAVETLRAV
jgi:isopentenyl diphosphate isomerase/L-lactate dehydrogenase-like FMN-dependent dehydrogenase